MKNKIDLTVALPLWNMKKISWLQLESFCRQETKYNWELIVCEEQSEDFTGEDVVMSYGDRLQKAGCESITYIPIYLEKGQKPIPLSRKWIMMAEKAKGANYILSAGDNYSPSNRIELTHSKMLEGNDWFDVSTGLFLHLKTFKTGTYAHYASLPDKSALFMAVNTELIKQLTPLLYQSSTALHQSSTAWPRAGIDGWMKDHIDTKSNKRYRHQKELLGLHTDGANQISGIINKANHRPSFYENGYREPFIKSTQKIEDILPSEIIIKLKQQFLNNEN